MNTLRFDSILAQFRAVLGVDTVNQKYLAAGENLFLHGDAADCAYVLSYGTLSIVVPDEHGNESEIDRLQIGAVVGEMGILAGGTRTATVRADTAAVLIALTPDQFTTVQQQQPHLLASATALLGERWQRVQLIKVLEKLFGKLDVDLLHSLQSRLEWVHLNQGERLFAQGEQADGMYIVVNGRLQLVFDNAGEEKIISDLIDGETIGSDSLILDVPRSTTPYAVRASSLVKLSAELFHQLAPQHPQLMRSIMKIVVERQQRLLTGALHERTDVSLLVSLIAADSQLDLRPFAEQLAEALSGFGRTRILTAAQLDAEFGQAGASQWAVDHPSAPALSNWLFELEAQYQHLILLPDNTWSAWTQRCLNQSDRVLVVANPQQDPEPQALEKMIVAQVPRMRRELVLWHSAETQHPTKTINWLNPRGDMAHYHVRDGDKTHFRRVARRTTGRGIGLVLAGGAARGYVHAGVHRRLEEFGIEVDYIGGTSFGSLIGCFFAREMTALQVRALFDEFSGNRELFDTTLPFVALNASSKLNRVMQKLYSDWRIEDLWIPFFCIGANLTHATEVVMERGLAGKAIRKSISVPGIFAPVVENGEIFVDGGIINNFPADEMAKRIESPHLIGVLAGKIEYEPRQFDIEDEVSGWKILAGKLNPFARKMRVPSIAFTLLRTMEVYNVHRTRHNRRLVEVLIAPETSGFDMLDFEPFEEIAALGYESAEKPLKTWWENYQAESHCEPTA